MTERDIKFLLKKYETKQPGEIWAKENNVKNVQEYRMKQLLQTFDVINSNEFQVKGNIKKRVKYLLSHIDLKTNNNCNSEQIIVMLIIYAKMEYLNYSFSYYYPILKKHGINKSMFINFLVKLNKFHANNSYI